MSFKKFLFSKIFIKNLALAMAFGVGLIMILLIWMNIYTRHGQARPVPDFYGLNLEETAKLAKKSKLRYEVVDSVFTTLVPRGSIAEQNPKPGFKVKKTRRIALTINAFSPEMVGVPNLIGLSKKQAIAQIESSGLEVGKLNYKPDLSVDFVLDQLHNGKKVERGDSLQKRSVIDLVLGKGLSNQRTLVPDLIGLHLESARNKILSASFNLGTFIYDGSIRTATDTLDALVFKQNPEYKEDASYQLGSAIYLWLTVDSAKLPIDSSLINLSDTIPVTNLLKGVTNSAK
jgi:beta-lactam-binding protein with PASTA domain